MLAGRLAEVLAGSFVSVAPKGRACHSTPIFFPALVPAPPPTLFLSSGRQKGDSKREKPDPERTFSQIFADFR